MKKNKLYFRKLKCPSDHNSMFYRAYRNKLNHILRGAERKYYNDLLISNKNNSKKLWSILKGIINRNAKVKNTDTFCLDNGGFTRDPKIISNNFNDFFVNIGMFLDSNNQSKA